MREEARIFKPSHRLHAIVEQANAIQQGRRRPTEVMTKFYLGDERVVTQTEDHAPPPTADEMRGERGVLDMYNWGEGEGNDTYEKYIAIQSGISNKYEQQFKAAPEIQPYMGELITLPDPKAPISSLVAPAPAVPAVAQALAGVQAPPPPPPGGGPGGPPPPGGPPGPPPAQVGNAAPVPPQAQVPPAPAGGMAALAAGAAQGAVQGEAAGQAPPAARAEIRQQAAAEAAAEEGDAGAGGAEGAAVGADEAAAAAVETAETRAVAGMTYDAKAFINNRQRVTSDYYGAVPRVRGAVHAEIQEYLESEWDGAAGEFFLDNMDNFGNYRNDEAGGVSREQWELARESLITFLRDKVEGGTDLPPAVGKLYSMFYWGAEGDELEADEAHGRPGAKVGEHVSAEPSQPLRPGTDQAPGDDDEEDVDEYADELESPAPDPVRAQLLAISKAGDQRSGVARGLSMLRTASGYLGTGILGGLGLARDVAMDVGGFLGGVGSDVLNATQYLADMEADAPRLRGAQAAPTAPMPSARARAAPQQAAAPQVPSGPMGLPSNAVADAAGAQAQERALAAAPAAPAAAAAAAAAADGVRQRRSARVAEKTPEERAAIAARIASEGRSGRGKGKPNVHNMARLAELYEQSTGDKVDKSDFDEEDGSFSNPKMKTWFKSHMRGDNPESKKIRAMMAEIDDKYNMKGGMKGQMNGCGKPSIECCSDSESEGSVKGAGKKRARFPKGSQEARDHMAAIRAKRKPKV